MLTPEQTNEGQAPEVAQAAAPVAPETSKPVAKAAAKPTVKRATKAEAKVAPVAKREHDESEGPAPTMVNGVYVGGDDSEPEVLDGVARVRHMVDQAFSTQPQLDALHAVLDLVEASE